MSSWSKRVSSNRIWPPVRLCRIRGTRYVISRCTGHGSMDTRHCVARRGESGRGKPSFRGGGSRWMDALECRLVTGGARVVKWRSDQDAGNWPDSRAMGRADTGWISGQPWRDVGPKCCRTIWPCSTFANPASLSICPALVIRSNFERSRFVESGQIRRSWDPDSVRRIEEKRDGISRNWKVIRVYIVRNFD